MLGREGESMGFRYRKSFKAGPFRVTASKSGISYSAGVKGARITKRADGRVQTTLSAPGTGLGYTSSTGGKTSARSRPAPARTPSIPAAPKPLGGQRASVMPQRPPLGTPPIIVKGYLATVTLHPDQIQIDRTWAGRINGNRSAAISWQDLVGVDFLDPTRIVNGHIHFATGGDPRGLSATGRGDRMAAAAKNPHAIMFTWQQRAAYERLRDMLTASAAPPPQRSVFQPASGTDTASHQRSVADELAKLHALFRQGALTRAEFERAKARLLGQ
jgi:hypothetical protein